MIYKGSLTTLNGLLGPFPVPRDGFVQAFVQYPNGGTGTILLEGTLNGTDYETIALTPSNSATQVTTLTARGVGSADVSGYLNVQVRMSVIGSAAVAISLPTV